MRLIECYVTGFGKLRDKRIGFKNGLNTFLDENGSGKTTLAAFIKAMLYGIGDTKKANLDENDRKRYTPWGMGAFGGSLTFEARGREYRIERSFGRRASEDEFKLYDVKLGRESSDFSERVGEELFGIDVDGFERTVFLSERSLSPKSENKSISAKLSDLVGTDADIGEMDTALKVLDAQRKLYSKRGGGEIDSIQAEISRLEGKLRELDEAEKRYADAEVRLAVLDGELATVRDSERVLLVEREQMTLLAERARYKSGVEKLKSELVEITQKRDTLLEFFGGNVPTLDELNDAAYKKKEAERLLSAGEESAKQAELDALDEYFNGKCTKEDIDAARVAIFALERGGDTEESEDVMAARDFFDKAVPSREDVEKVEKYCTARARRSAIALLLTAFGILIAFLGCALYFTEYAVYAIPTLLCGAVMLVASILIYAVRKSADKKKKVKRLREFLEGITTHSIDTENTELAISEVKKQLSALCEGGKVDGKYSNMLDEFLSKFFTRVEGNRILTAKELVSRYERYSTLSGDRAAIKEAVSKARKQGNMLRFEAESFFSRYKVDGDNAYAQISQRISEYTRLSNDIISRRQQIESLKSVDYLGGERSSAATAEDIGSRESALRSRAHSISGEQALLKRQLESDKELLDTRDELISERERLLEKHESYTARLNIIRLTEQYLKMAKENMTSRYLGKTSAAFKKYAEIIGGDPGEELQMDASFGTSRLEGGATHSTEAYSRGTRELYRLATRLSLIDSLYENEELFIMLDDPFISFDDKRTDAALRLLSAIAKRKQIIYFTCSKSRTP